MDASLTHGIENGVARWPDEMPQLEQLGRENFAAIREAIGAPRHRRRLRGDRRARRSRPRPTRPSTSPRSSRPPAPTAGRPRRSAPSRPAPRSHSPTYHGAAYLPDGPRAGRPGAAGLGARGGRARPRACGVLRALARWRGSSATATGVRATTAAGRDRARAPRRARHQRLPAAGARDPPLRRAGLRLRARQRAARRRAARVARLGAPPGPDRPGQPVPLLPADERRPHPVRRLRRRSTTSATAWAPTSTSARPPSSCSPRTSSRPSPSSRACASPTAGAARSTPARASR